MEYTLEIRSTMKLNPITRQAKHGQNTVNKSASIHKELTAVLLCFARI